MKHKNIETFIGNLAALHFDNAFNPYTDTCPEYDKPNASKIRQQNLALMLEAAMLNGIDSIWIARDLGYRGGRRTGLALTDECHLRMCAELHGVPNLARATHGPEVCERTATIVWEMIRTINRSIFLWNVFPLHPHEPNIPFSNRCHSRAEQRACQHLLLWLIENLNPQRVVTIGKDSQNVLKSIGIQSLAVRHPSYGGQSDFIKQLSLIYKL